MFKKCLIVVWLLCFVSSVFAYITEANHPYIDWSVPHKKGTAVITYNYDGDTITTSQDTKIRLLGVNTPELKPYQEGSKEAKQFTERFCKGKEADVVVMNKYGNDRYGRTLALVFVDDKCLNWELLKNNLAEPMVFPQATILKRDMWESGSYQDYSAPAEQGSPTSGWAKLIKSKEPEAVTPATAISTPTARAVLAQQGSQPITNQEPPGQPSPSGTGKETLVMAFGGKRIIPQPVSAEQPSKARVSTPRPKVVVGDVVIESGKTYKLRLITSGQGHYVLEVVVLCGE